MILSKNELYKRIYLMVLSSLTGDNIEQRATFLTEAIMQEVEGSEYAKAR